MEIASIFGFVLPNCGNRTIFLQTFNFRMQIGLRRSFCGDSGVQRTEIAVDVQYGDKGCRSSGLAFLDCKFC